MFRARIFSASIPAISPEARFETNVVHFLDIFDCTTACFHTAYTDSSFAACAFAPGCGCSSPSAPHRAFSRTRRAGHYKCGVEVQPLFARNDSRRVQPSAPAFNVEEFAYAGSQHACRQSLQPFSDVPLLSRFQNDCKDTRLQLQNCEQCHHTSHCRQLLQSVFPRCRASARGICGKAMFFL